MKLFLLFLSLSSLVTTVSAHGMVTSPRSRPYFAYEEGVDWGQQAGKPPREYCSHCLNGNRGVCGFSPSFDYDEWRDTTGNPMPWISQDSYEGKQ